MMQAKQAQVRAEVQNKLLVFVILEIRILQKDLDELKRSWTASQSKLKRM
jgi:hypothetical protein